MEIKYNQGRDDRMVSSSTTITARGLWVQIPPLPIFKEIK